MKVTELTTEYADRPLGLDTPVPRLSWISEAEEDDQFQTAYQVLVASRPELLSEHQADLWNSGKVASDQSVHVPYGGRPLASRQPCYWKVRVWDKRDAPSAWSRTAHWSMGVLSPDEWTARWIGRAKPTADGGLMPSPYLRKTFAVDKPVRRAMIYASALGLYELHLNGERVGEDYFAPGWTDYAVRVQYQTYDVTNFLAVGEAAVGAILGTGWYAGNVGMFGPNRYGDNPYLLLELHIEYTDGSTAVIVTDESWRTSAGAIAYSDLLKGESYDARLEPEGWSLPGFDDSGWEPPVVLERYGGKLVAQVDPPVRVMKELVPVSMKRTPRGTYIFDMGQNMVGWVRLTVDDGREGQRVTVTCAEMLNEDGTLYTINLREAVQRETYILKGGRLKGEGTERLEPHFTFHGFRYVEVEGIDHPTLRTVTGRVAYSAMPQTGWLRTSDAMLNKLISNIEWGQRGNFLSVPTDCPQRDERLGWTGDAQIFARTACCSMEAARFFSKYMTDVLDARLPSGAFPDVAPDAGWEAFKRASKTLNWHAPDSAGWGDAGVIIPWTVYQMYGDTRLLESCFPAMAQWVDYLTANTDGLIRPGYSNYGDWLSVGADTPKDVLDTAYYGFSAQIVAKAAQALGREEEARKYAELFERIRQAFTAAFVGADGRIKGDTQTVYAVALKMNLLPEELRAAAAGHLADNIRAHGNHLTTGFLGVGYLLPALTESGRVDVAYDLLEQHTFPSWLYSVKHGATTIWERWDAWTETDGFQNPGMNSFNHYSLGSVGEWMYRAMLGIDTDEARPGFKHIIIHPRPGGGLHFAKGEFRSVHGLIGVEWKRERSCFTLKVRIPVNTTATVIVPGQAIADEMHEQSGVTYVGREGGASVFRAGSGCHTFVATGAGAGHPAKERRSLHGIRG